MCLACSSITSSSSWCKHSHSAREEKAAKQVLVVSRTALNYRESPMYLYSFFSSNFAISAQSSITIVPW